MKFKGALFLLIMAIHGIKIIAQPSLTTFAEVSKIVLSDKATYRSAIAGAYKFGNNQIEAAFQTNLINGNNTVMSGYSINGSRGFRIKNLPLSVNGFWLCITPSEILKETNYGAFISMKLKHFEMKIGTSCRTYGLRRKAVEEYSIENGDSKIHENFNLIYSFTGNLRPPDSKWNTGVTVTNMDYFLINQETNPFMKLHFSYKINSPVNLFAEAVYKNAGLLNMSLNNFSYAIKIGLIWKIN